ncbi:MAG: hypothetical protein KGQ93_03980 [Cyanobacteria bacterium REEB459]|nr:hypothetical protein [Cyanobacteria bacterium REEB459]
MISYSTVYSPGGQIAQVPGLPISKAGLIGIGSLLLTSILVGIAVSRKIHHLTKQLNRERYLNQDLRKKIKMAVQTITKMEQNPDLIHSREFNLDYLRMRMEEEVFHAVIVNQLKVKVKQKISLALRPPQVELGVTGVAGKPRLIDEIFDVEYQPDTHLDGKKRVLFRIQIKLAKLPTQTTSSTIGELVHCIEKFMDAATEHSHWQPTIQGRIASIHWDQRAKPTPLLVFEQSNDGATVTFRSKNILPLSQSRQRSSSPGNA